MRVLLINPYDIGKVFELRKKGILPDHHLFGMLELANDLEVEILNYEKYSFLNKIGDWFDIGFLDQQIRALLALRKNDILYAPFAAMNTKLMVLGKLFGLIRKPLVILVHHPLFGKPSNNKLKRFIARKLILSYDTIIFFSKKMHEELIEAYSIDLAHANKHFSVSPLGADLEFFKRHLTKITPPIKPFVISSGNTGRDFDILIEVAKRIDLSIKIYCKPESFPKSSCIPDNVEILSGEFPFEQICKDIANSRIVLIPLSANPQATNGLVSLLEAMALAKPIIMTKNKYIDIDFEKENIGVTVDENDVDGWAHAITSMLDDYPRLKEMGENSLRLAREKFNINIFAKDLAKAMNDTHQRYLEKRSK